MKGREKWGGLLSKIRRVKKEEKEVKKVKSVVVRGSLFIIRKKMLLLLLLSVGKFFNLVK